MIQYACRCGAHLAAEDDEAGNDVQCPACGLLLSVPLLSEVGNFVDDGTYRVGDAQNPPPTAFRDLYRAYTREKVDLDGQEIDRRSPAVRPDEAASQPEDLPRPRYDPMTGELIRPIPVEPPIQTPQLPRPLPVRHRSGVDVLYRVEPAAVFARLLEPGNLAVIVLFLLAHLLILMLMLQVGFGLFFMAVPGLLAWIAVLGHTGNVIDETGPAGHDELPRPLRNLSWSDDIWSPFVAVAIALLPCVGLPLLAMANVPNAAGGMALAVATAALGLLAGPAVLLIAATSGSAVNLLPHRVLGTIGALRRVYGVLLLGFFAGFACYLAGVALLLHLTLSLAKSRPAAINVPGLVWISTNPGWAWLAGLLLLAAGAVLLHWHGWCLGRSYRVYHRQLPWANQGSYPTDLSEPGAFPVLAPRVKAPPSAAIPVARKAQ